MRKDSIREYIATAIEAYDLAATTPPLPVFKETKDDEESFEEPMRPGSRRSYLDFSIDIKRIYDRFIVNLIKTYGPKRAERFSLWLKVGYIEQFHSDHRRMIKWDRKELNRLINEYKGFSPY